jgi:hypothetical protein
VGCTRLIRSPWETPCEILSVAIVAFGRLGSAEDIKPFNALSFADAKESGFGGGGADSSAGACVVDLAALDITSAGAASCFLLPGPELAAIRSTGELPEPADGLSAAVAAAVFGAKVWLAELARSTVSVEGAVVGEDMGRSAGAGCPEFCGVLEGVALVAPGLPSFS